MNAHWGRTSIVSGIVGRSGSGAAPFGGGGGGGAGAGIFRVFTEPRCSRFDPGSYERPIGGDPLLDAIKRMDPVGEVRS